MSLIALLAPALFELLEPPRNQMVCAFGAEDGQVAEVRVIDRDLDITPNGQFKVAIVVAGEALAGRVAPYATSEARDVVLRARSATAVYLIALRDNGSAVLRTRREGADSDEITILGSCTGFEPHLDRWLAS